MARVPKVLSRLIPLATNRQFELRFEVFNLFNRFNWGRPVVNLNSGQFGRITTQAGAPRIMQLGIKFDFQSRCHFKEFPCSIA